MKNFRRYPWTWQRCTALGDLETYNPNLSFTSFFSLSDMIDACKRSANVSDPVAQSGIRNVRIRYGGLDIEKHVSKVVFTYGEADPWSVGTIRYSSNPEIVVLRIEDGHHCSDLDMPFEYAAEPLLKVMKKTQATIEKWLKAAEKEN